jgi:BolA protein
MTTDRITAIRECLESAFPGGNIQITDESHLHAGHAGALTGKGHFAVKIVTGNFSGREKVHRHRMIYAALGDLMQTDIHALRIDARTPDEM